MTFRIKGYFIWAIFFMFNGKAKTYNLKPFLLFIYAIDFYEETYYCVAIKMC